MHEKPPPWPESSEDRKRWRHTRLRRRILYGEHEEDLRERTQRQVGKTRFEAWGRDVDMSSNVAETVYSGMAVQYDKTPTVSQEDGADISGLVGSGGLMTASGIWQMMPRIQRDSFGLRTMLVRVNVADGLLTYRRVFPDMVTVEAFSDRPDVPVMLKEARLYTDPSTKESEWCWDVLDIRDPSAPSYHVVRVGDGVNRSEVYISTPENLEGDMSGERYPYRFADGTPFIPYAIYRPVKSGSMWDAWTQERVFDGTLQAAVFQTQFAHIMRSSSWGQKWAIGVEPAGTGTNDENADGHGRRGVISDPAVLLIFEQLADFEGQPTVGTFPVSCSPSEFQEAIGHYERRVSVAAGLPASDVLRMSGDPRSGYALAISREGMRIMQRKHEEEYRRSDQQMLSISAAIANRSGLGSFPESGYRIEYLALPKTPKELQEEAQYLADQVASGMLSKVEAYQRQHPGISAEQAEAALRDIAEVNRRFS